VLLLHADGGNVNAAVFLVDDDAAVLRGLTEVLEGEGLDVRSFASAEAFLAACSPEHAGCVVLDVRMPGLDGMRAHEALKARDIGLPVIFLTGHGDVPMSVRAMKAGAFDFLEKPVGADALIARVYAAFRRDEQRRGERADTDAARSRLDQLTRREREVLAELLRGKSSKEVARDLRISPRTVEAHRRSILLKTRTQSLLELERLDRRAAEV
jgi:FixJ family two-component response regulator